MSIVYGTDFSERAVRGADAAAALAVRWHDTLRLVHVQPTSAPPAEVEAAKESMAKELDRLRELDVALESELLFGEPAAELVRHAAGFKARALVLASPGIRSDEPGRHGATSRRVAQSATVPVIVVRDPEAFRAWAWRGKSLRLVVGVDLTRTRDVALRWAADMERDSNCELILGHVYWPMAETVRLGVHRPPDAAETRAEVESFLARDLRRHVRDALGAEHGRVVLQAEYGPPGPYLVDLAEREHADLLVVGTHQRRGLDLALEGSASRDVVQEAPMAVACIPLPEQAAADAKAVPALRTVLAATDFTELGDRAIPYAYAAVDDGGTVVLLHVMRRHGLRETVRHWIHGIPPGTVAELGEKEQLAFGLAARLRERIPPEAALRGIDTRVEVVESGEIGRAISEEAERSSADLVCMATHGRSAAERLLTGSVTNQVAALTARPLFLVRGQGG